MNPREHFRGLADTPSPDKDVLRETIRKQTKLFESFGGKVQVIANGVSGVPERKGQVHLSLKTEKQKAKEKQESL